jgi:quercetin dioxygenase-like cupin family protein
MKNSHCMLLGALLTVVLSPIVAAQDVVKVSPETHTVLLENDRIRVLEVHVKPGEHVAMHSHPAGVLYYLSDAKLKITYPDGRTQERTVTARTAAWSDATTHAVENIGATELHEVHTEMKGVRAEKLAKSDVTLKPRAR